MVKLIIEDDEGKTTVVPLIRDEITIGRKEGNTIRLTERNVSRRHARLVKQNGGAIFIEDLGSYNGIRVNGNRINGRVAVAEGDRIQIGDYVLGLKLEGVVEAAAQAAAASRPTEPKTMELPRPASEAPTAQIEVSDVSSAAPAPARAEAAPEPAPTGQNVGRLVCVSTNFPGQEWLLDKSLLVIGRTDDNDIVVNHRSISRHHARIVEEHGRYTIVDLQSSNGVRVNGEEYGKVELRRGDLVDLGHVRLRFVAAGEDFVFSRDASVVDISKPGGGRGFVWIAVTAAVLLMIGALVWKFALPGANTSTADTGSGGATGGSGSGSAAGSGEADDPQLATDISNAMASEEWATAISNCQKLRGAQKETLKPECEKAASEKMAKESFDSAFAAAMANRDLEAVKHWSKIPETSTYKQRDREKIDRAREKALTRLRTDLGEAAAGGSCDKARQLGRSIKELDPSDSEAEATVRKCGATAEAPDNKTKVKRPPRKIVVKKLDIKVPAKVPPAVDPAQVAAQVSQLVQQAQSAYVNNNHSRANQLAKQALKLQANHGMATQILGASACYLKNEREARAVYDRLPPGSYIRNTLRSVCQRVGISLQ